jgi:hydroxypyruvate isomerase
MTLISRREALTIGGTAAAAALASARALAQGGGRVVKKGRLKQSVCRWCYAKIPFEDFCRDVAAMGLTAIDLLQPEQWATAAKYGLTCSTSSTKGGGTIRDGLNNKALHDSIVRTFSDLLPKARQAGVPNVITFFGNRHGMPDPEAIDNCVAALNRIKPIAEDNGVTVVVELLNSKVDHKDYQGDRTAFGVEVMKRVASPRVKLLYDIYHMQIMEGDVIRTVRDNWEYIAHFHTGGVPGRHELDETQELQWATIARAITDKHHQGYFAHEFIPTRDPLTSLREAVALCDI